MRHRVKKVKKLGRPLGARKALYKGLLISLIDKGEIETTIAKAKGLKPQIERLVCIAKKQGLSSYRILIAILGSSKIAAKLVREIAPKFMDRNGGFVRIQRSGIRSGDAAQMARIGWVVNIKKVEDGKQVKKEEKVEKSVQKKSNTSNKTNETKKSRGRSKKEVTKKK